MPKPVTRSKTFGIVCLGLLWLLLEGCGWAKDRDYGNLLENQLKYPKDLQITIFAEAPKARHMAYDDQGVLFLSQTKAGKVVALPDADGDGKADRAVSIMKGGNGPHGLAFLQLDSGYYLYIAEQHRVVRLKRTAKPFTFGKPEVIVTGIPTGGHSTRTIKFQDGKLYLSVGSSCNVCIEEHPWRSAIIRFDVDGKNEEVFARGLRNSVGIEFSPYSGELWGVNNGRDWLGDDHPREELNIIRLGKHYGWPYCYEDRVSDPDFGDQYDCKLTEPPAHTFTAHMAPLGLEFYKEGALPVRYNNSLFVSFHGSWNRSVPAGYQVRRLQLDAEGNIQSDEVFIEGWLQKDGSKAGRPVDSIVSPRGELLVSDDYLGVVYRITGK
ncbi:PQQ-dependent sugar dehydrogenase [Nitrospina sp. 32_T5]|uniref:PQQ-dependent sugar dehydrogenase n=1 Tax=unclassified Nitrospina TaxID=2638683 RepID=UPI003F94B5F9